jgi:alpha-mannosidase
MQRPWVERSSSFSFYPVTDLLHASCGLALAVPGLYEYEIRKAGTDGELLITLLRSVDTLGPASGTNYDTDRSLALGSHSIRYAFFHETDPIQAFHRAAAFITPIAAEGARGEEHLPRQLLASSNPRLIVSACKPAEEGRAAIIRMWNPSGDTQHTEITFGLPTQSAVRSNLAEEPDSTGQLKERAPNCWELDIQPYAICTLRLVSR